MNVYRVFLPRGGYVEIKADKFIVQDNSSLDFYQLPIEGGRKLVASFQGAVGMSKAESIIKHSEE